MVMSQTLRSLKCTCVFGAVYQLHYHTIIAAMNYCVGLLDYTHINTVDYHCMSVDIMVMTFMYLGV